MNNPIFATWCISNNIGDALTPWLIQQITGDLPLYVPFDVRFPKHMVTGSVLNHASQYTTVWGAGFADSSDELKAENVTVKAVRGPLTARRIRFQAGVDVTAVGDPALLVPRYFNPDVAKTHKVGVCPHYIHQREFTEWIGCMDIKLLNVFDDAEKFAIDIKSCEVVYSSSLHGLILADAYGIPSQWIAGTAPLGGDGLKFHDHLCMRDLLGQEDGYSKLNDFIIAPADEPGIVDTVLMARSKRPRHIHELPKDIETLHSDIIENKPPDFTQVCDTLIEICPFKKETQ